MGQWNARFRHSDKLHRLLRGDCERQRLGISQADIFARKDYDAARDETKIFAGVQHFRQPIDRTFFIRSAHALNEFADRVVMRVTFFVINDRLGLNALLSDLKGEMNEWLVV